MFPRGRNAETVGKHVLAPVRRQDLPVQVKNDMLLLPGARKNAVITCIHRFLAGSVFSIGVFSHAVELSATPPGALDGLWTSATAWTSLVASLTMIPSGIFLNNGQVQNPNESLPPFASKTRRAQALSLLGALGYSFLSLAAVGVSTTNAFIIRVAVALQGIPLGLTLLLYIEILASWMPDRRGLSLGLGFTAFGLGCMSFSSIYHTLLQHLNCANALHASAAILVLPSLILTPFSEWAPRLSPPEEAVYQRGTRTQPEGTVISWRSLPFLLPFWLYLLIVFTAHAGYAMVPYFFQLGLSFELPMQLLVTSFQITYLVNSFSRPFSGMLADSMKWGHGQWAIASKNLMKVLFFVQMILFLCLVYISERRSSEGYIFAAGLVIIVFGQTALGVGNLARDIFSASNSSLVLGVGAGVGMGIGGFTFVQLMAWFDQMSAPSPFSSKNSAFYACAFIWSFIGLLSSVAIQRCEKAFGMEPGTDIFSDGTNSTNGIASNEKARAAISAYGAIKV